MNVMGLTIIHKSDPKKIKPNPKIALVLAGGAISGAVFKIGGLKALNDYLVNKKLTDFDIYVGLSAGALLAVPLCGGISPEEMLASLDGKSQKFSQISPFNLYKPNWKEFITRPLKYFYGHLTFLPGVLYELISASPRLKNEFFKNAAVFFQKPNYSNFENLARPVLKVAYSGKGIPAVGELFPSGIFDNEPLAQYLKQNMKKNKMPNNFRALKRATGKSLYISAMDLDGGDRVIFGPDEKNDVEITEAVQASSAIPGFYKPARIKGVDYIDGGVRRTANIDLALEKGADLVICYNPFRPYNNKLILEYVREKNKYISRNKRLADWGLGTVLNQVFRTLFHSRLHAGLNNLKNDPNFKKDVIVIEPAEDDADFFTINPLFFWNRAKAAKLGFESVTRSLEDSYKKVASILELYGIKMSPDLVEKNISTIKKSHHDDAVIMQVMEQPHRAGRALKLISGGKN